MHSMSCLQALILRGRSLEVSLRDPKLEGAAALTHMSYCGHLENLRKTFCAEVSP